MVKKLTPQKLSEWLSSLASAGKLFGPIKKSHEWGKIKDIENLGYAFENTLSPKDINFPQDQTLFKFDLKKPVESFTDIMPKIPEGAVLWGLHPCDARALDLIHRVYNENDYKDPYFNTVWDNMIRIATGCTDPPATCFCTSFKGGSPFGTQGVDVMATEINGEWLFEAITQRANSCMMQLPDAVESDVEKLAAVKNEATDKVNSKVPTEVEQKLWQLFANDDFWFDIGSRCLGCGICTFVCPSCYCFDILDEHLDRRARRYRTWDACQFGLFTLEASGHDPRPTQKHRIRQRMMHKLSFFAKRYDGTQLCVGCGRCVRECPVNIDIREVARNAATK